MQEYQFEFSDGQAITTLTDGSSVISTNVAQIKDVLKDAWDAAKSPEVSGMWFNANVQVALVGSSAALDVDLYHHTTATVTSGSKVAGFRFPATSVAGTKMSICFGPGTEVDEYIGAVYTANGGNVTSATINCWAGPPGEFIYPV